MPSDQNITDPGLVPIGLALRVALFIVAISGTAIIFETAFAQQTQATSTSGLNARVLLHPVARIDLQSELMAPILKLPFREGDRFSKGDLLVEFDCRKFDAELLAAKAALQAARIEHGSKKKLLKYQAAGKNEVALALSSVHRASAEMKLGELRADQCKITAPFSGSVIARHVNANEYPPRDKPILSVLDETAIELEMIIPSNWLRWLEIGQKFALEVDETGATHDAIVARISPQVDAVSQTIKVTGTFGKMPSGILAGMSGTAYFDLGS